MVHIRFRRVRLAAVQSSKHSRALAPSKRAYLIYRIQDRPVRVLGGFCSQELQQKVPILSNPVLTCQERFHGYKMEPATLDKAQTPTVMIIHWPVKEYISSHHSFLYPK